MLLSLAKASQVLMGTINANTNRVSFFEVLFLCVVQSLSVRFYYCLTPKIAFGLSGCPGYANEIIKKVGSHIFHCNDPPLHLKHTLTHTNCQNNTRNKKIHTNPQTHRHEHTDSHKLANINTHTAAIVSVQSERIQTPCLFQHFVMLQLYYK